MSLPRLAWPRRPRRLAAVAVLLALTALGVAGGGAQLWAWYQLRAAEGDLQRYHLAEAREHLRACLLVWPHSGRAHLLAARAARQTGDYDDAQRHLAEADRLLPNDKAISLEYLLTRAQHGSVDATARVLRAHVESNGADAPLVLEAMARGYMADYRLPEAEEALDAWLARQPDNVMAHMLRGTVRQQAGDARGAADEYDRVVALDPTFDEARLQLATTLLQLKENEAALPHLEYVWRRAPKDPRVLVLLAHCQYNLGHAEEARRDVDAALAAEPRNEPALEFAAELALEVGRPEEAEGLLRRALEVEPNDYQALYTAFLCLQRLGKDEEARQYLARAKRVEEDFARLSQIATHDMAAAPRSAALAYQVGMIHLRSGDKAEGLHWLDQALKLDPGYVPAHAALADYYASAGEERQAAYHRRFVPSGAKGSSN